MKKELSILNNTLHLFYFNYEKLSQAKKKKHTNIIIMDVSLKHNVSVLLIIIYAYSLPTNTELSFEVDLHKTSLQCHFLKNLLKA